MIWRIMPHVVRLNGPHGPPSFGERRDEVAHAVRVHAPEEAVVREPPGIDPSQVHHHVAARGPQGLSKALSRLKVALHGLCARRGLEGLEGGRAAQADDADGGPPFQEASHDVRADEAAGARDQHAHRAGRPWRAPAVVPEGAWAKNGRSKYRSLSQGNMHINQ